MRCRLFMTMVVLSVLFHSMFVIESALGDDTAAGQEGGSALSLQALLDLHLEWLGGREALTGAQEIRSTGTISMAGLTGSLKVVDTRSGFRRIDYDLRVVSGTEVVGATTAWEINPSGQLEDMGENKAVRQRLAILQTFWVPLLDPANHGLELRDPEQQDNQSWNVIRWTSDNGDIHDYFIDPVDGSQGWMRDVADADTTWIHSSDWRVVDGIRVSHRTEQKAANPMENSLVEWVQVEVNPGIDPTIFIRPDQGKQLARFLTEGPEWISFDLYLERYIYIPAMVNGEADYVLLDTGAGITVLDASVAKKLNLTGEGALPAVGTGGAVEASIVRGVDLVIGNLELSDLTAAVIDLSELTGRFGRSIPVILGKELFNNVVVDVDYPNSRIAFRDPEIFRYSGEGTPVPLIPAEDGHKLIEVEVEDLPPARVTVDTGSGGTLTLFSHYTQTNGLLEGRSPLSTSASGGVGGMSIQKVGTLSSFTIGGFELTDVPVGFHVEDRDGAFDTTEIAGNLGAGILSRFRIIFDYERDHLYLEPGENWDGKPFRKNRLGLQASRGENGIEVIHVSTGSPAEADGWKDGDLILSVNGREADDTFESWIREIVSGDPGTEVVLRDADGNDHRLVLADYY